MYQLTMAVSILEGTKKLFFKINGVRSYKELFIYIARVFWLDTVVCNKLGTLIDLDQDGGIERFLDYLMNSNITNAAKCNLILEYLKVRVTFHSEKEYEFAFDTFVNFATNVLEHL